jgi:hypothetical protein
MRILASLGLIAFVAVIASMPVMLICASLVDLVLVDRHRRLLVRELIEPDPPFTAAPLSLATLIAGTSLLAPRLVAGYKVTIALAPVHWRMVTIAGALSTVVFFLAMALLLLLSAVLWLAVTL